MENPKITDLGATKDAEIEALISRLATLGVTVPTRRKSGFMRIWIDRQDEILSKLRSHTKGGLPAISVMLSACARLPLDGQRMTCTQAELAADERWQPSEVSRAFKMLAALEAIMLPKRDGKSLTWEIDARLATRMDDAGREAAIRRQRTELSQQRALEARRRALKNTDRQELTIIEDERQPPLV